MEELFDKEYFHGKKKSNYSDYEKLNPLKHFKSAINFIKNQNLNGRFLDVGCAFGFLLKEVSPFFSEIHGCDISEYAIGRAKEKNPSANLQVVNLDESFPYPDESFDCITALDVLEHTKNLEDNFTKITKKLKKGGHMIVSVPINNRLRKIFGFLDKDKTHISVLSKNELIQIVNKNNLQVISKRYFFPCPFFYKIPHIPAEAEFILRK